MNDEGAEVRPTGDTRIAVVGEDATLTAAIADVGIPAADPADADLVVAVGETALLDSVTATAPHVADRPVLAVGLDGPLSVSVDDATDMLPTLASGQFRTTPQPILAVDGASEHARALFDVTLVTAEPARISEFSVHSGGREVDRFRADGVVVATPLGSHEYTHAAGGPVLAPDADSLVTVPISPFAIGADEWVLPCEETALRVEREEAPVECFADATRIGTVTPGEPIRVRPVDVASFVRPPGR